MNKEEALKIIDNIIPDNSKIISIRRDAAMVESGQEDDFKLYKSQDEFVVTIKIKKGMG